MSYKALDERYNESLKSDFNRRLAKSNDEIRFLKDRIDDITKKNLELQDYARKGLAFEQMLKACENPVVKAAWDRFMMTLRMTEEPK